MSKEDIIAMAREAGFRIGELQTLGGTRPLAKPSGFDCLAELEHFAALVAAKERERIFGKAQSDGEMRLVLFRWENGQCFSDTEHFTADQTHWWPNDLLHMAVDRMEDRVAAGIAAAIRARDKKESGSERI